MREYYTNRKRPLDQYEEYSIFEQEYLKDNNALKIIPLINKRIDNMDIHSISADINILKKLMYNLVLSDFRNPFLFLQNTENGEISEASLLKMKLSFANRYTSRTYIDRYVRQMAQNQKNIKKAEEMSNRQSLSNIKLPAIHEYSFQRRYLPPGRKNISFRQ